MYQKLSEIEKSLLPKVKGMMVEEDLKELFEVLKHMAWTIEG
jgi:hypothetical protein